MQADDDHAKDYYYSPTNNYDFTPNDHFARHDDNSTPDHDHGSIVYHDFRVNHVNKHDDIKHNRTAWSAHECPACIDEYDFRSNHYDNGRLGIADNDDDHGPDAGIEPGLHGC